MPRINIEDRLFSDHRFITLSNLIGDQELAIGICYRFFRSAQGFWCPNKRLIPIKLFDSMRHSKEFEIVGLATRKKNGIYISGTKENFRWLMQKYGAGSNSAKSRRKSSDERYNGIKSRSNLPSPLLPLSLSDEQRPINTKKIFSFKENQIEKIRIQSIEKANKEASKGLEK